MNLYVPQFFVIRRYVASKPMGLINQKKGGWEMTKRRNPMQPDDEKMCNERAKSNQPSVKPLKKIERYKRLSTFSHQYAQKV